MEDCYWERTSKGGEIIDNQFATSAQSITVTIAPSDGQLTAEQCGVWKPVKEPPDLRDVPRLAEEADLTLLDLLKGQGRLRSGWPCRHDGRAMALSLGDQPDDDEAGGEVAEPVHDAAQEAVLNTAFRACEPFTQVSDAGGECLV
ncbi:hypothetical protein OG323_37130 (plasmid) [Streptomyces cyaneofuscatus]|uniref:hypothetical protein n=1 Tax=Streptomyces cyaneofuscatus TaxID=66883 RepID=UPI0038684084|nr:hypothetical protein OG323_00030 [Streptomyces cyaneofuscatus]WTA94221.1 hypothetical protein OG323_37075 [Streptomyces cyaneofuscatus]WTA94653.1 hypothetical protein OG323_37130 [Streptomyces cyaneofuscatus]